MKIAGYRHVTTKAGKNMTVVCFMSAQPNDGKGYIGQETWLEGTLEFDLSLDYQPVYSINVYGRPAIISFSVSKGGEK